MKNNLKLLGVGPVDDIKGKEWRSYITTGPHSEYPSGTTCFCSTQAQVLRRYFNSDIMNHSVKFPRGSSFSLHASSFGYFLFRQHFFYFQIHLVLFRLVWLVELLEAELKHNCLVVVVVVKIELS